ncbi:MAG: WYL domain-containing protein [Bacteroidales bacterium]|nr:WYL domain-containing protein [Bacteroidales bacterium]
MSTNKNALIRYHALDKCLRNPGRRYDINDLVNSCNDALLDIDPNSSGIKKRQVYEDLKFMQDSLGYQAPIIIYKEGRRAFYRYEDFSYSISSQPLNELEAQQLKESLLTLSRFKGLPQFEWLEELTARLEQSFKFKTDEQIISFEDNPDLEGREYISVLYNAIVHKRVLEIQYQPFNRENALTYHFHPYHLKQYNNRWFIIGRTTENGNLTNIALDRIKGIKEADMPFISHNIDFEELFYDVIGVSINNQSKPEKVKIKVYSGQWNYIRTKPLHASQRIKEINESYTAIEINVYLNHELEALLLSFGENIEVLEPIHFRERIAERIKNNNNNYECVQMYRTNT